MGFGFNYGVDPTDLSYLHGVSACHGAVTKCLFVVIQSNVILNEHIDILWIKFQHDWYILSYMWIINIKYNWYAILGWNQFQVNNYHFWRADRTAYGGGIAAYVRSDLPCDRKKIYFWI